MELWPHGQPLDWRIDQVEPFEPVVTSAITFTRLRSLGLLNSKDSCSLDTWLGVFNAFLNATSKSPYVKTACKDPLASLA